MLIGRSWVQHFLSLKGQVALAKYLTGVQAKEGKFYSPGDDSLELETLKCFKCSLNNVVSAIVGSRLMVFHVHADFYPQIGVDDALHNPPVIEAIAKSLLSPNPPARKVAAEILTFFAWHDQTSPDRAGLALVLRAFDALESEHNKKHNTLSHKVSKFELWLRQTEDFVYHRGRMGSTVGQGPMTKGMDQVQINDYCVGSRRGRANPSLPWSYLRPVSPQPVTLGLVFPSEISLTWPNCPKCSSC